MREDVIYNELPLTEAFIPSRLLHREGQLRELERCLKPALHKRNADNVFLIGPTGTGKTSVAKWILESYFKEISCYINCWKYRSTHEVLREILLTFQIPVHGREPTSELVDRIENILKRKKIMVCLDEVDQLKDFDVLYTLARNGCGLILASTHYHALMHLPSRIKSSLALTEIEFPKYRKDELFYILKDRVQFSFKPGTIKTELIRIASVMADGDARVGLEILRRAGRKAENRGKGEVTLDEIKEAAKEARKLQKSPLLSRLNEHERTIYELLQRKGKLYSGELYRDYCRSFPKPVVDRAYRKFLERMVQLGLVAKQGEGRWRVYNIVD